MLIRSQDKTSISTDLNSWIKSGTSGFFIENRDIILGHYSTKEKAIKVLDIIQNAYAKCESVKALSNGTMVDLAGKFNQKQSDDFISEHRATFVFQMPRDSEV